MERASRVCGEDSRRTMSGRKKRDTEDSEEHGGDVVWLTLFLTCFSGQRRIFNIIWRSATLCS